MMPNRPAKLGDTIAVAIPAIFELRQDDCLYFDQDGRPCDKHGELLYVTKYRNVTLETPEAVDYFNRTGKVLPDA